MDRQQAAYLLMLLMALAIASIVAFKSYHSHHRSYRRRIHKENAAHERLMAERSKAATK